MDKDRRIKMANLWTGRITANDYVDLATASGQTFTTNYIYTLQSYDNAFYIREGSVGEGFIVKRGSYVQFEAGDSDIYVKPAIYSTIKLNISEKAPKQQ